MSQTSYIAGGLFIGFLVFITIRGELPAYSAAILGGGSTAAAAPGGSDSTTTIPPLVAPVTTDGHG